MLSRLITHFRRPFNSNIHTTMLGRWTREPVVKSMYIKVDQANEDHCGCCNLANKKESVTVDEDYDEIDDNLLRFYCM